MEVCAEFPGDVCHGIQRVYVAGFSGACNAADGHDPDFLAVQFQAFFAQRIGVDPVVVIGVNRHQEVPAEAEHIGGFAQ